MKSEAHKGQKKICPDYTHDKVVNDYVKANNIKNPFKDCTPGEDWYLGFMKRHPCLSLKKPELLQAAWKKNTKPDIVYDFYCKLESWHFFAGNAGCGRIVGGGRGESEVKLDDAVSENAAVVRGVRAGGYI